MPPLSKDYPALPSSAVLKYLGEGAANIIYRVTVPSPSNATIELPSQADHPRFWQGKLLRLRKDLPHTIRVEDQHNDTVTYVHSHFNQTAVIQQSLINIKHSQVINRLNAELRLMEQLPRDARRLASRLPKRYGVYLADDNHGLVIEDMTPPPGLTLLELKPKWLHQSPAAPPGFKRCRTCAKRARDSFELEKLGKVKLPFFCPLDLVSSDDEAVIRAARSILQVNLGTTLSTNDDKLAIRLARWAKASSLLMRLKELQRSLDQEGVFHADPNNTSFRTAMTLRDCSIYFIIPTDPNASIEAKLGDLDLKQPNKVPYWREVEQALIVEGWYAGNETVEREGFPQPLDCNIYRRDRDHRSP